MAIHCAGSINIDHVYRVAHLPRPGETLAAVSHAKGLGGKGANQSIAAARAGASVQHIGRIGCDGAFAIEQMAASGVGLGGVVQDDALPTGHAIITVDADGENAIVLFPGANAALEEADIVAALARASSGDTVVLQNEVNASLSTARIARDLGLRIVYSAAPFDAAAARAMLPLIDLLILNEGEATALEQSLHKGISTLGVEAIVTRGPRGALWHHAGGVIEQPAFAVSSVLDTTGAGDCFAGYLVAGLDAGLSRADAMRQAAAAAALQVTRPGAADAMPDRIEVQAFLAKG